MMRVIKRTGSIDAVRRKAEFLLKKDKDNKTLARMYMVKLINQGSKEDEKLIKKLERVIKK